MATRRSRKKRENCHGLCRDSAGRVSPEYLAWAGMIQRCCNSNLRGYHNYGGRGITVCDGWRNSFMSFAADMGPRPTPKHTIDRYPDQDGGYWCGRCEECRRMNRELNCRWATMQMQNRNRRNNHILTVRGRTQTMAEWCEELGLGIGLVASRVNQQGWTAEEALFTPTDSHLHYLTARGRTQTLTQWCEELGLLHATVLTRLNRRGWTVEEALFTSTDNRNRYLTVRGRTQTMTEWAKESGIDRNLVRSRIDRMGWSAEDAIFTPARPLNRGTGTPRQAVSIAVKAGRLPRANTLACQRCDKQARGYYHHLGTDREHLLDVIPLCWGCYCKAKRQGV